MKKGFFYPSGNNLTYSGASLIFFWIVFSLAVSSIFVFWIFKRQIRGHYLAHEKILGISKKTFWLIFGFTTLFFSILRQVILVITKFPNQWETLPLHLCRIVLLSIAMITLFNKLDWIKNISAIGLIAAIAAFSKPDFKFYKEWKAPYPIGLDSYYYWDYLFAHSYIIIMIMYLSVISVEKWTIKDTLKSIAFFGFLALMMFIINWITYFSGDEKWRTNYWYLGGVEGNNGNINPFYNLMGRFTHWPYNLFTFVFIGFLTLIGATVFYCWQDKLVLAKNEKNKLCFKITKSENWAVYKESMKNFFSKKNKINASVPEEQK